MKKEFEAMLKGRTIKQAYSPWGFTVVIAQKKDGFRRFCKNYERPNKIMKAENLPIPMIEGNLDGMAGAHISTKRDRFAGYWKVKLAQHVQGYCTFT